MSGKVVLLVLVTMVIVITGEDVGECPSNDPRCVCNFNEHNVLTSLDCSGFDNSDTLPTFNATTNIIPTLRVENSTIYRLHNEAFRGLRIRNLLLNNIEFARVDEYALLGLEQYLESLEIKNSKFVSLPDFFLYNFTSLNTISLDGNLLGHVKANWFTHLPMLTYLSLSKNRIRNIEPGSFDFIPNLQMLYLSENKLAYLNDALFSKLTHLQQLGIGANNLTNLPIDMFKSLSKLEVLDLNRNLLEILPNGIFNSMVLLKDLYLSSNKIREITPTNMPSVSTLEVLILSNNNITVLKESAFNSVINLKMLALDNNHIVELPDLEFENLKVLQSLHLQNNEIDELPSNILVGLFQLEELQLQHNNIKVLTYGVFDPLGSLKYLDISNNYVKVVEHSPFTSLRKLEYLDLSSNLLSKAEANWFGKSAALLELRLNHNQIRSIEANSFLKMQKLEKLNLEHNYIQEVDLAMFAGNKALRVLSLFHNPLTVVQTGSFGKLTQLETLYLNYTCIKSLPDNFFLNLTKVTVLKLDHTPIEAIQAYSLEPLKSLHTLILGYHNLSTITARPLYYTQNLLNFTADKMSLSHNDLANLLVDLPNVRRVSLKHNMITSLPAETFTSNPQLQQLSLYGNPLLCDCQLGWLRNFMPLTDVTNTVCASPSKLSAELAACFPLPVNCQHTESLPSTIAQCDFGRTANSEESADSTYDHCIVPPEPTTPIPTTTTTTAATTIGPVEIFVQTNYSDVFVMWDRKPNPNILGFRVRYRVFATNNWKYSTPLGANETQYRIADMVSGRKYFVCVDLELNRGYSTSEAQCKEIDFMDGNFTTATPTGVPTTAKEELPLIIIIGAAAGAIIVTFIIIIVIVCALRKTRTRFTENAKRKEAHDQMVKDKMGMWVNTFSYDGDVQETMGEQMMLDYDLFSKNNPTISRARYEQMLSANNGVMPDVLVVGDTEIQSKKGLHKANNAIADNLKQNGMAPDDIYQNTPFETVIPHGENSEYGTGSDRGYGESEIGYNESNGVYKNDSTHDYIMF